MRSSSGSIRGVVVQFYVFVSQIQSILVEMELRFVSSETIGKEVVFFTFSRRNCKCECET